MDCARFQPHPLTPLQTPLQTSLQARVAAIVPMCVVLVLGMLIGCGSDAVGELTAAQCSDFGRRDEDGDGLRNCDDPDCWAHDFCRMSRTANIKGQGADAAVDAAARASAQDSGAPDDGDSGEPLPMLDAGAREPCDDAPCPSGEVCPDGPCAKPPAETLWQLRVAFAVVPDQRPTIELRECYDTPPLGKFCLLSSAALCGNCKPDPYVVVLLNGAELRRTLPASDTQAPSYTLAQSPAIEVALHPEDELVLRAFDADGPDDDDDFMFECTVRASTLTSGVLQCVPTPDPIKLVTPPLGTTWGITIEYAPVAASE